VLEARVAADLAAGRHAEVVGELEALVREHPFREGLWAHLMVALYRVRRQADALASYQRARTVLADELGLEPGAELRRLERAILDHDPSLEPPPRLYAPPAGQAPMPRSPVRYARCADGVHVAYQTLGDAPRDLLTFPSAILLPFDAIDEEPNAARFQDRLASFSRVIRFDPRGIGFSDPVVAGGSSTLEQWVEDALAVMDAAGAGEAVLFAPEDWSLVAVLMAATHPDRVRGLVVVNGTARLARDDDYPMGIPRRFFDRFLEVNFDPDAAAQGFDFMGLTAPTMAADDAFRAWWDKAGHRAAGPTAARAIQSVTLYADVRSVLPLVRVPTLVLHRRGAELIRVGHGRHLAEHIPNARYVELDGDDEVHWVGDTAVMLDEIEDFFAHATGDTRVDRLLTTILFAGVVGSAAQSDGDGELDRATLDRYEAMVARLVARLGGRPVRSTGGPVALFDGPARAVRCACAIRDAGAQLGLVVRAGLHTGEVEIDGDDVAGVAVDVAARVQAAAEPNQVFVSRTVVDLVAGSGLRFADSGLHDLGGESATWRLFSAEG
jgi:class 3 adenylate cyclase